VILFDFRTKNCYNDNQTTRLAANDCLNHPPDAHCNDSVAKQRREKLYGFSPSYDHYNIILIKET